MVFLKNNLVKNVFSTIFYLFIINSCNLFLNPFLLSNLGSIYFATLRTSQKFLDVVVGLDGGAIQALKWKIAHNSLSDNYFVHMEHTYLAMKRIFQYLPLMLIASLFINWKLSNSLESSDLNQFYAFTCLMMLALSSILTSLGSIFESILIGMNLNYKPMLVRCVAYIVSTLLVIILLDFGLGLLGAVIAISINVILVNFSNFVIARKSFHWIKYSKIANVKKSSKLTMNLFSRQIWIWEAIQRLTLMSEIIVLVFLGEQHLITQLIFMNFGFQLGLTVLQQVTGAITPKIASKFGSGTVKNSINTVVTVRYLVLSVALICSLILISTNTLFVEKWAGQSVVLSPLCNFLLGIMFLQTALFRVDSQLIDTTLKVREKFRSSLFSLILAILLGVLTFKITHSVEALIFSLIFSRTVLSFSYARLVNRYLSPVKWKLSIISACLIMIGLTYLTTSTYRFNFIEITIWNLVLLFVYFLILPKNIRSNIHLGIRSMHENE